MTGRDLMPKVIEAARDEPEIQCHLWNLYNLVVATKAKVIVELGVRAGHSTRALLCGAQDIDGDVWSCDLEDSRSRLRSIAAQSGFAEEWRELTERWTFNQINSVTAGDRACYFRKAVDLVFVDTEHSLDLTRREIAAWWPTIRVGGHMLLHDTLLAEPGRNGVLPAIREFMEQHGKDWTFENHIEGTGMGFLRRDR